MPTNDDPLGLLGGQESHDPLGLLVDTTQEKPYDIPTITLPEQKNNVPEYNQMGKIGGYDAVDPFQKQTHINTSLDDNHKRALTKSFSNLPESTLYNKNAREVLYNTYAKSQNINVKELRDYGERLAAQTTLERADKAFQEGNTKKAEQLYMSQIGKRTVDAFHGLANMYHESGDEQKAQEYHDLAIEEEKKSLSQIGNGSFKQPQYSPTTLGFWGKQGMTIETDEGYQKFTNEQVAKLKKTHTPNEIAQMERANYPIESDTYETEQSRYLKDIADQLEIVTPFAGSLIGSAKGVSAGIDKTIDGVKDLSKGYDPLSNGLAVIKTAAGVGETLISTLMATTPEGGAFNAATNVSEVTGGEEANKLLAPVSSVVNSYYDGKPPEFAQDVAFFADILAFGLLHHTATHIGKEVGKQASIYNTFKDFSKEGQEEAIKYAEDRAKKFEGNTQAYHEAVTANVIDLTDHFNELKDQAEGAITAQHVAETPHVTEPLPKSVDAIPDGSTVQVEGNVFEWNRNDNGEFELINLETKEVTPLKADEKATLKDAGITFLPKVADEQLAKISADPNSGTVTIGDSEYFVSPEHNFVGKKVNGEIHDLFDSHNFPEFGAEKKNQIMQKFLEENPIEEKPVEEAAQPTEQTPTALRDVESKANKAFHGSPIIGEKGKLTPSSGGELGGGVYFTRNIDNAKNYSRPRGEVQNMAEAESKSGVANLDLSDLKIKTLTKDEYLNKRAKFYDKEQELNNGEWNLDVAKRAEDKLIKQYEKEGYDGLEVLDEQQGVIFPNSVKKAKVESLLSKEQTPSTVLSDVKLEYNDKGERLAPNGEPSNLSESDSKFVRSKVFKDKYGDWEKGKDATNILLDKKTGEPLKVYHGVKSNQKFDRFEKTTDVGFHFSPNKSIASDFARNDEIRQRSTEDGEMYEPVMYEGFINTKDIEGIEDLGLWTIPDFKKYLNGMANEENINWEYDTRKDRIQNTRDLYSKIKGFNPDFKALQYFNEYEGRFAKGSKFSYILFNDADFIRADKKAVESLLSKEQTPTASDVESTAKNNNIIKQNKIEGGLLNEQQSAELQKEIESKYNTVQKFGQENEDIRQNLYNYDNPLAEKDVNGVNLRIADGLIEGDKYSGNRRKTYLLYADGKIAGKFYSVADIKRVVRFIEDNLIKSESLLPKEKTPAASDVVKQSEPFDKKVVAEIGGKLKEDHMNVHSLLTVTEDGNIGLNSMYVKEGERGNGIATKFLTDLKSEADKVGKKVVAVATDELGGDVGKLKKLYEKNGFTEVEPNKFEYNPSKEQSIKQTQENLTNNTQTNEKAGIQEGGEKRNEVISETVQQTGEKRGDEVNIKDQKDEVLNDGSRPKTVGVIGNSGETKFTSNISKPFTYKLIEADDLQASHLASGERNPNHQIASAQPKERNDSGSKLAQDQIAENPNLKEVSESPNAYFGAPIVNEHGEVIQGNNRSIGLKKHYKRGGKKYKSDLANSAEKFGLTKDQVDGMKNPILVREIKVSDQEAVTLGQHDVKDIETGGKQALDPIATSRKMSPNDKSKLTAILFGTEGVTLKEAIRDNANKVGEILKNYINTAQHKTLFNADGSFTAKGMDAVSEVVNHFMFDGGNPVLPEIFDQMPNIVQKGLQKSLPHILSLAKENSLIPDIQNALMALSNYHSSGLRNIKEWAATVDLFKGVTPKDIFSATELKLAEIFDNAKTQNDIKNVFLKHEELVSGKPADMFEPEIKGSTKNEAIKQQFGIDAKEDISKGHTETQGDGSNQRTISKKKVTEPIKEQLKVESPINPTENVKETNNPKADQQKSAVGDTSEISNPNGPKQESKPQEKVVTESQPNLVSNENVLPIEKIKADSEKIYEMKKAIDEKQMDNKILTQKEVNALKAEADKLIAENKAIEKANKLMNKLEKEGKLRTIDCL